MSESFEKHIDGIAQHLSYPSMPKTRSYQPIVKFPILQRVASILLVLLIAGFAVPDIRAAVFEVLQIGSATITLSGTTETGEPLRLEDVTGETTLEDINTVYHKSIYVPPNDLPDRIYVQEGSLLIMLWVDGREIERALYQIPWEQWGIYKGMPQAEITEVHGDRAVWGVQDHFVTFSNGEIEFTHFVTDQVLIWTEGSEMFRLEGAMSMDEAIAIAESLVVYEE